MYEKRSRRRRDNYKNKEKNYFVELTASSESVE